MAKSEFQYLWTDKKRTLFGLPLSLTRYFLTETKFITRKGLLNLEEDELDLYKVLDKKLVLPVFQRMFGCGTIVMNVKDVDTPVKEIRCVKMPRQVLKMLDERIERERDKYRVRGRDIAVFGAVPRHDPDDDIHEDFEDESELE